MKTIKRIAYDLLSTLQMMHSKGVVHLDLNPDNIIITDPDSLV